MKGTPEHSFLWLGIPDNYEYNLLTTSFFDVSGCVALRIACETLWLRRMGAMRSQWHERGASAIAGIWFSRSIYRGILNCIHCDRFG